MAIDQALAARVVREEANNAEERQLDRSWLAKIERLSELCAQPGASKTHIAFLATAILAKAVNAKADLFAIKPDHAAGNRNAFSARSLCHSILVPLSAELAFSLGVSGREPLNNQPYFRMTRLDDGTPVAAGGRAGFDYMLDLVRELQTASSEEARRALRAFISVRRKHIVRYADLPEGAIITPRGLAEAISKFVSEDSEGGKRAQAIVAGLLDIVVGPARVESGRINDPSRHYPGDVAIRHPENLLKWEKAIEVRDKVVRVADIHIFGRKCAENGVNDASVVMVASQQPNLNSEALDVWASENGIGITLFHNWSAFVDQALFWSPLPKPTAAVQAVNSIHNRLKAVEVTARGVALWTSLISVDAKKPKSR